MCGFEGKGRPPDSELVSLNTGCMRACVEYPSQVSKLEIFRRYRKKYIYKCAYNGTPP